MTIGIITTNYFRLPVLKIFCEGIDRLREETDTDIPVVCVGTKDGEEVCLQYGIDHHTYQNSPLTGKFNRACELLKGSVDYVMVMGSDNLISTETFLRIKEEAEKGIDLIGLSELYMLSMDGNNKGKLYHFPHTTVLGVGRTVSARVLDKLNWNPWGEDKDRGIDVVMLDTVRPHVKTSSLLSEQFIVDLKTKYNLNPIDCWSNKLPGKDINLLWDNIGNREQTLIKQYIEDGSTTK